MKSYQVSLPNLPQPFLLLPIEGGHFHLGDEYGDLHDGCRPVHPVMVGDFYMGQFPMTQAVWKAVMNGENSSGFPGDDRPVERVSWEDAQEFIKQLNKLTKLSRPVNHFYRLPTEAEWEYAARGGKYHAEGYKYAGSDRLKDVGWFNENSGNETKPVGLKYPNQLGLHDMSGNVYEWCEDRYGGKEYYEECKKKGVVENPLGPEKGASRVLRGSSWYRTARSCRVASRFYFEPDNRFNYVGFRLVLALQSVGRPGPAFR